MPAFISRVTGTATSTAWQELASLAVAISVATMALTTPQELASTAAATSSVTMALTDSTASTYQELASTAVATSSVTMAVTDEWGPGSIATATFTARFDSRKGITYSTSLSQAPASGPAITLSGGSLTVFAANPGSIRLETVDDVTFKYSLDGGENYPDGVNGRAIPHAGTYTPPATAAWPNPPTFNFAAGTYGARVYATQLAVWNDVGPSASHHLINSSANGPIVDAKGRSVNIFNRACHGVAGGYSISANGAHSMKIVDAMAQAVAGSTAGVANFFDIYILASTDLHGGAQTLACFGNTTGNPYVNMGETAATNHAIMTCVNDANAASPSTSAIGNETVDVRAHVLRFTYDASGIRVERDGIQIAQVPGTRGAVTNINAFAIFGFLFHNAISQPGYGSIADILIYSGSASTADAATIVAKLKAVHDAPTPRDTNVLFEGDSFFAPSMGESSAANVFYGWNDRVVAFNSAVFGSGVANIMSRAAAVDAHYNSGAAKNILFLNVGGADIGADGTGDEAQLQIDLAAYIAARKAAGWYVVLTTMIPRNNSTSGPENSTYHTKMLSQNAWRRAGGSGANALADYALTWPGTVSDRVWLLDDIGHPSPQGASYIRNFLEAAYKAAPYRRLDRGFRSKPPPIKFLSPAARRAA